MDKIISRLTNTFLQKCEWRIPMVGLDSSGKTTILYKLKPGENGFNVECVEYRNVSITIWDVGGQSKIRSLWRHYFHNANGLIFVVHSNDRHRILEARNELHKILSDFELRSAIILVSANKQDLPNAMNATEVAENFGLHSLGHRSWYRYIQSTSAISGQGLHRDLDWLLNNISSQEAWHDAARFSFNKYYPQLYTTRLASTRGWPSQIQLSHNIKGNAF